MKKMFKSVLLLLATFSLSFASYSQSTLQAGDIAIIGYNYDASPQEMSIVTLVPISAGTVIYITDYGYDENTSTFGTTSISSVNEGSIKWTTTSAIAAGTVIKFSITSGITPSVSGLPGTVEITGWTNTINTTSPTPAGGDNWFIFQGSSATSVSTFVFAWMNPFAATFNGINQPTGQFIVSGSGTPNIQNSYLPPSLTLGISAIALNRDVNLGGNHGDNNVYKGTKTGTKSNLLSAICNVSNWLTNETTTYDISAGGSNFNGSNPVFTVSSGNTAPSNIALSTNSIEENVPINTSVGIFSTSDNEQSSNFNYTLVSGLGSDDNVSFSITNDQLIILESPDYEIKNSYSIRVKSTDQGGLFTEKVIVITIKDVLEIPTGFENSNIEMANVSIFPNPTTEFLTISNSQGTKLNYKLVNFEGKTIISGVVNEGNSKIDVRKITSGKYIFILLENEKHISSTLLLKE